MVAKMHHVAGVSNLAGLDHFADADNMTSTFPGVNDKARRHRSTGVLRAVVSALRGTGISIPASCIPLTGQFTFTPGTASLTPKSLSRALRP